jgi:WD40 repeat protein
MADICLASAFVFRSAFFVPHTLFSHRSLPIYDSAWSPDGAVLALAQGSVVTLWDPASSTLRGTLACSEFGKGEVRKVEFVGKDGRWIIGAGQKKGLVAWDLVNGSGESISRSTFRAIAGR